MTDTHSLGPLIVQRRFNSLNIKRLKEIQCYRGKRHQQVSFATPVSLARVISHSQAQACVRHRAAGGRAPACVGGLLSNRAQSIACRPLSVISSLCVFVAIFGIHSTVATASLIGGPCVYTLAGPAMPRSEDQDKRSHLEEQAWPPLSCESQSTSCGSTGAYNGMPLCNNRDAPRLT